MKREPFVSGLDHGPAPDDTKARFERALASGDRTARRKSDERRKISDRIMGGYKEVEENKQSTEEAA